MTFVKGWFTIRAGTIPQLFLRGMMALTRWERKERLGHGAAKKIAQATDRSESHVSMVINEKRRDRVVEVAIARRLQMPVDEVFAPEQRRIA